jgi:hypothetical protein
VWKFIDNSPPSAVGSTEPLPEVSARWSRYQMPLQIDV